MSDQTTYQSDLGTWNAWNSQSSKYKLAHPEPLNPIAPQPSADTGEVV